MTDELKKSEFGRRRIYTDVDQITLDNVLSVVQKAKTDHEYNLSQIEFLLHYEYGFQPLQRKKLVRPEIDIVDIQNLAHYITDFKLSYNWGNPISYILKDSGVGSDSVKRINDMLDEEGWASKNQKLFRFIEITGIGYSYLNQKKFRSESDPIFTYETIDPRFAFKVYANDISETPMLDVIVRRMENGKTIYSCYTKDRFYQVINLVEIVNGEKIDEWKLGSRSGEAHLLGFFPLTEWLRDSDRMGCFEREIPAMDALNIKNSDFSNDVSQKVQALIHANDIDFPVDDNGEVIKPQSNQMICTFTTAGGKTPFIKSVDTIFDYSGVQSKIAEDVAGICTRCFVPQHQGLGGGSTGTAMSLSSGWSEAEAYANKQEMVIKSSLMEVMKKILMLAKSVNYDKDIAKLDVRKIEPHILRNKTYDLATKSNAFATLLSHGMSLKDVLNVTDISGDPAQVIKNSKKLVDMYQSKKLGEEEKTMQDTSDQVQNSPIIDGMKLEPDHIKPQDNKEK